MRLPAILFLFCASAWAQDSAPLPEETLRLARIRQKMADNLRRQPNYTCLETIERSRTPKGGRERMQDTLRLEVALVDGKELFAWPGARRFEDTDIRDMITTGTFGNGNYALHARALFLADVASFVPGGQTEFRGRPVLRYDFHVPRALSGYHLTVGVLEGIAGYHGSFYADAESLDVVRLEVIAEEIPEYLGVTAASDGVTYGWVEIGGVPFRLPVESELAMSTAHGESRNLTRFSACRQYSGESVLRFDDAPEQEGVAPNVQEAEIPKGLDVELALTAPLLVREAAVGDPIEAEAVNALKKDKRVLVPKGARVYGRITRLERYRDHTVLGITFSELEWPGWRARIQLALDRIVGVDPPQFGLRRPVYEARPGEGIVLLRPGREMLARGILIFWRT